MMTCKKIGANTGWLEGTEVVLIINFPRSESTDCKPILTQTFVETVSYLPIVSHSLLELFHHFLHVLHDVLKLFHHFLPLPLYHVLFIFPVPLFLAPFADQKHLSSPGDTEDRKVRRQKTKHFTLSTGPPLAGSLELPQATKVPHCMELAMFAEQVEQILGDKDTEFPICSVSEIKAFSSTVDAQPVPEAQPVFSPVDRSKDAGPQDKGLPTDTPQDDEPLHKQPDPAKVKAQLVQKGICNWFAPVSGNGTSGDKFELPASWKVPPTDSFTEGQPKIPTDTKEVHPKTSNSSELPEGQPKIPTDTKEVHPKTSNSSELPEGQPKIPTDTSEAHPKIADQCDEEDTNDMPEVEGQCEASMDKEPVPPKHMPDLEFLAKIETLLCVNSPWCKLLAAGEKTWELRTYRTQQRPLCNCLGCSFCWFLLLECFCKPVVLYYVYKYEQRCSN